MPFKNEETGRAYQRDYKRLRRAGSSLTPSTTQVPTAFRLETARDIRDLLAEQIAKVRDEPEAGTLEKARTIGFLAGVALKAVELTDLLGRVESIETTL